MSSLVINPETGRIKVRWVIAHFPIELFLRTAKAFSQKMEKLCPGQFEFEIHTFDTYSEQYKHLFTEDELVLWNATTPSIDNLEDTLRSVGTNKKATTTDTFLRIFDKWKLVFGKLRDQEFEVSQNQVSIIGSHLDTNYHAIDLPFLFKGHDHVAEALDGEIGNRLGNALGEKTGIRGLAFTYSGGYRIVGSTEGITNLNDLNSKKFIPSTATSYALFKNAGVDPTSRRAITSGDISDMCKDGGAIETTYLRFTGKNILKTNHSMFTTSIIVSDKFLNQLTPSQRKAFETVAKHVAKSERIWSLEDAAQYEADAESRGVTIVDASEEDISKLRTAAQEVYKAETLKEIGIDSAIVNEIIELGKKY